MSQGIDRTIFFDWNGTILADTAACLSAMKPDFLIFNLSEVPAIAQRVLGPAIQVAA